MEFRYREIDGAPPREFYPKPRPFSFAPLPPPPSYSRSYFPPRYNPAYAPSPPSYYRSSSDYGYFDSDAFRAMMLDYKRWREELLTGYDSSPPIRRHRDPFLERECEKEIIRERILREEARRRILEEEVRWELEMERYYGLRQPSSGYHSRWPVLPYAQPRYSDGCHASGSRGQVSCKANHWVREVPHKIVEINEEELISKEPLRKGGVRLHNKKKFEKKENGKVVQKSEKGNKIEQQDVREISHKIMETNEEERPRQALHKDQVEISKSDKTKNQEVLRPKEVPPQQALVKDKVKPSKSDKSKNQEELRPKEALPQQTLLKDKTEPTNGDKTEPTNRDKMEPTSRNKMEPTNKGRIDPTNRGKVKKKEDGQKVLKPENVKKVEQLVLSPTSKELVKKAGACGSKRKVGSILALPYPATTSNSTDTACFMKNKRQKLPKKQFTCVLCSVTVTDEACWLGHLNGKKHRNKLKTSGAKPDTNKKEDSEMNKKCALGVVPTVVKVEMDKESLQAAEPTRVQLEAEKPIVKMMQVGQEMHEVVERNNRLWCEKCQYKCTTNLMMTIHLVSEKHKASCWKQ